jgi:tRNA(Ile)-lysidine synthase
VLDAVRRDDLLARGETVVVAVSGGGDSSALLLVLDALARRHGQGYRLIVAHLDHGLRGRESAADADFVAALAGRLGLDFSGGHAAPPASRANLEEWCRRERQRFLAEVAAERGATKICLGHTRDDQAETVLMRLARGAGPGSLAGMRSRRPDGVVRPLLERARPECAAYVAAHGLTPRHDGSNDDDRFFRNRIRRHLLPELDRQLGVDVSARLARFAADLGVEAKLAEERIADVLASQPAAGLAVTAVAGAGPAAGRLVHAWLARQGIRATHAQVDAVVRIAMGPRPGARVDLASGRAVQRSYDVLEVVERQDVKEPISAALLPIPGRVASGEWSFRARLERNGDAAEAPSVGDAIAVDAALLGEAALVRAPRPGDRIRLPGGSRKVSDVLGDARIPRALRCRLAVVAARDGAVLWIPGVAASVAARMSHDTRSVVVIDVERGLLELMHRGKNPGISRENCRARV